jgi:hypothetical protein
MVEEAWQEVLEVAEYTVGVMGLTEESIMLTETVVAEQTGGKVVTVLMVLEETEEA